MRFMSFTHAGNPGLAVETSPGSCNGLTAAAFPGPPDGLLAQPAAQVLARGPAVDMKTARFAMPTHAAGQAA